MQDIFGPKFGERYVRVSIDDATLPGDLAGMGATTKVGAGGCAGGPTGLGEEEVGAAGFGAAAAGGSCRA